MNRIQTLISVVCFAASASAVAQNTSNSSSPATQRGTPTGKAAQAASTGASGAGAPTLMQQREKGMSPDGASGQGADPKATGKIKQ
ncbi:hypothetical protein AWB77_04364 [Caballeronia fortuita]|uniref:Lipoprotein n=1 Tax=Caballeronia fortuita TaxID=1777138 RepID=A0A158CPB5_9BURK|nr:hypothetical protein [Caballeronia fortuita]SAK84110.1 hypothetical protein AWB77_04364 [Caballeronia fortuita]